METLTKQELKVKAPLLQEMVGKAVKACSFNDSFAITKYFHIEAQNGNLSITATDNINILKLTKTAIEGSFEGNLDIVVDARVFSALISRITTPFVDIVVEDKKIVVKGNGKYDIPLLVEEDGSDIAFPTFDFDSNATKNSISNTALRNILTMNKSTKADMKELPELFNYYMDNEKVLTSDSYKACLNPVKLFEVPVSLPPTLVDLISLVSDDNGVTAQESGDSVLFSSSNGFLYGKKATREDLEQFPVDLLMEAFNEQYNHTVVINKTLLSNALDRISLFTDAFNDNGVLVTFDSNKVTLLTTVNGTHESVNYVQPISLEGTSQVKLEAVYLKNQLAAIPKEEIVIKFGNENGIQLVCDKIVQLTSSLIDENEEVTEG